MATLSRQNSSRRSVDGPVDMQIALLSQKVKDGSRGSVRVACGVRAIGGGSILQEPLAPYLAGGEEMRNLLGNRARREDARVVENVAVRHRAIDDVILRHCTPARGIRQVVSINGGLDSRAYRLNLPEVSWFDVDLFDVLELKKRLLEKAPEALRAYSIPRVQSVTPVGMDVLADAPHYLRTALEKQGVDFTRPVLYVFEACLYNFEAEKAKTLMRSLPRTKGSVIVATHFQRAMLKWVRDPRHQAEAPYLAELAHHWRSSLEECARNGAFRGWRVRNAKGLSAHARAYGYSVPPNLWAKGEEVVFEMHRGYVCSSRRSVFWRTPNGPIGPPATAGRRDAKGLRSPDASTAVGGWVGVLRRAALYTACGFIGHRHGGDIARFCERNLKETYDRVVSTGRLIKVRYVDPSVSFAVDKCGKGAGLAREGVTHVRRVHVDSRLPEKHRRSDLNAMKKKKGWQG